VRWQHPDRGLLPPGEFIELAEECGLMVQLGAWVLREACRQGAAWAMARAEAGMDRDDPGHVGQHLAPAAVRARFRRRGGGVLRETGFPADRLWLEITEGALLRDPAAAIAILESLRSLGVHLAIDDFGTGYSSLSYLKRLPVEALKIDRSFVEQLDEWRRRPGHRRGRRCPRADARPGGRGRGHRASRPGHRAGRTGLQPRPGLPLRPAV
jgi:EAL domain-containing protein (putative c-di-GMP-specific phosphodiesterase class I)